MQANGAYQDYAAVNRRLRGFDCLLPATPRQFAGGPSQVGHHRQCPSAARKHEVFTWMLAVGGEACRTCSVMAGLSPPNTDKRGRRMQGTDNATMLLGRVLLSLLFLIGGTTKLLGPAATQAMFVKQGLPMVEAAWILAVVVELGGGLAMLFGLFTRPVGLVLAIWCVATALIAHSNIAERAQEIQFFKNMGLTGGFLYVAALGAGAWSLDSWRLRRRDAVAAE